MTLYIDACYFTTLRVMKVPMASLIETFFRHNPGIGLKRSKIWAYSVKKNLIAKNGFYLAIYTNIHLLWWNEARTLFTFKAKNSPNSPVLCSAVRKKNWWERRTKVWLIRGNPRGELYLAVLWTRWLILFFVLIAAMQ